MSTYIPFIDESRSDQSPVAEPAPMQAGNDGDLVNVEFGTTTNPGSIWAAILSMLRGG